MRPLFRKKQLPPPPTPHPPPPPRISPISPFSIERTCQPYIRPRFPHLCVVVLRQPFFQKNILANLGSPRLRACVEVIAILAATPKKDKV